MTTNFYKVFYADNTSDRVFRLEDLVACKLGNKKIKSIKHYMLTENGWKEKVIV